MDKDRRRVYEVQAEVLRAVAHPVRLAILDLIADRELCVCDIVEQVGGERSNVSRHLAELHRAGIVRCRKEGLFRFYALQTPCIMACVSCVTGVVEEKANSAEAARAALAGKARRAARR